MSTGGLFSFNPAAGETPETLKRRRAIAEQLLANATGAPASTIGGGLAALGQAIGGRLALGRVGRAEAAGQAGAAADFSKLWGGGVAAPTAPVPGDVLAGGGGTDTLSGAGGGLPGYATREAYIRASAPKYGIDPDTAVAVWKSERPTTETGWQSEIMNNLGVREPSYGDFQLHDAFLGKDFRKATGLDPSDPSTWQQNIDFALGQAAKQGWTPWHGAARVGIGARQGIGGGASAVTDALTGTSGAAGAVGPAGPAGASSAFNFSPFATGGAAARPDSFSGLQPAMSSGLGAMISSAPPDIQAELKVLSGYRSPETQERLWQGALKKYGSASAARKWVAPPGRSQHGAGNAIDWKFASKRARDWAHQNAAQFGFTFPLSNEPWHMEVAGARGSPGGPAESQNASGIGRTLGGAGGGAGGVGVPAVAGQAQGGIPAVMEALTGAAPQQEAVAGADPVVVAALAGTDPAAKDDLLAQNVAAFRPAGGPTPYNPLAEGSANAGTLTPVPDPNMRPAIAPVAAPEAPPVAAAAPAATGVAPVAQALGVDPLPQTSGLVGPVASAGHESLSPGAQAVTQALAGGGGADTLAGGGGRGILGRIFGGGTRTPAAVAGGGGGVPSAAATGVPGAGGGFSPRAQAAIAALQNPWLNEGQQAVAKAVLDQEIAQADPKYQVELAKIRYDLAVAQAKDPVDLAKAKHDLDTALAKDPLEIEKTRTELDRLKTPTKKLTPEEAKAAGLSPDAGTWQVNDDGDYSVIPGTEPADPDYDAYKREALQAREAAKAAGVPEAELPELPVDRLTWRKGGAANLSVSTGDTADAAFAKAFGTKGAETFFERREVALDAALSLEANNEARALLDKGVITGFGADWITSFDQAIKQLGFNQSDDASVNTQAFVATRAQEVGRVIKLFGAGTGLSDADREYARQAAAGDINLDERAIRRILDINDRAVRNVIRRFNADASKIKPELSPYPLTIEMPAEYVPPGKPASTGPTSEEIDAELKRRGAL